MGGACPKVGGSKFKKSVKRFQSTPVTGKKYFRISEGLLVEKRGAYVVGGACPKVGGAKLKKFAKRFQSPLDTGKK